jgi:hypothetical protein
MERPAWKIITLNGKLMWYMFGLLDRHYFPKFTIFNIFKVREKELVF